MKRTVKNQRIYDSIERHIKLAPKKKIISLYAGDFNQLYDTTQHADNKIFYRGYEIHKHGAKYEKEAK